MFGRAGASQLGQGAAVRRVEHQRGQPSNISQGANGLPGFSERYRILSIVSRIKKCVY